MIRRNITEKLLEALSDTPVVMLHGARQTGKSTLVQALAKPENPRSYITFDNASMLAAAGEDPDGFLAGLNTPVVLDEIQRVPDLFRAIKYDVDSRRQPGRYLLTGSANIQLLPQLSNFLVGRMEVLTLWPFSQGELDSKHEKFVDKLFSPNLDFQELATFDREELKTRIVRGGFPEAVSRKSQKRRTAWYNSYLTTMIQRDVRDLANIEHLSTMQRLMQILAARSGSLLNYAELSRSLGIPQTTLKRYFNLLQGTFLIQRIPPWSTNLGKRVVKSSKIMVTDTGLITALLDFNAEKLATDPVRLGRILETFVAMELKKQLTWSETSPELYHFRTNSGDEVDLLLEDSAGKIVGIEIKSTSSVKTSDLKGLKYLQETTGEKFQRGIILYTGKQIVPFSAKIHALPLNALWQLSL